MTVAAPAASAAAATGGVSAGHGDVVSGRHEGDSRNLPLHVNPVALAAMGGIGLGKGRHAQLKRRVAVVTNVFVNWH